MPEYKLNVITNKLDLVKSDAEVVTIIEDETSDMMTKSTSQIITGQKQMNNNFILQTEKKLIFDG